MRAVNATKWPPSSNLIDNDVPYGNVTFSEGS